MSETAMGTVSSPKAQHHYPKIMRITASLTLLQTIGTNAPRTVRFHIRVVREGHDWTVVLNTAVED
jgi:hypothetical protein